MGSDLRTSTLYRYCQTYEGRNLFVCDGTPFVSNPDKNPTLTNNALGWRASAAFRLSQRVAGDAMPLARLDIRQMT